MSHQKLIDTIAAAATAKDALFLLHVTDNGVYLYSSLYSAQDKINAIFAMIDSANAELDDDGRRALRKQLLAYNPPTVATTTQ